MEQREQFQYQFYEEISSLEYEKISNSVVNGSFDIEGILSNKNDFSENTRSIVAALQTQNLPADFHSLFITQASLITHGG